MKSIYIVDDNEEFRQSTAWWLEGAGYNVVHFDNPNSALTILSKKNNSSDSCILMDMRMPEMSGLDLHDKLSKENISIPVIYMTGHASVSLAVEAMQKGAVTYLEKPLDGDELQVALDDAFDKSNNKYAGVGAPCEIFKHRFSTLTPREVEVLNGIVEGKMNKVLAYDLGISIKTIEIHRSQVKKKMQARTATDLVKMVLTKSISH